MKIKIKKEKLLEKRKKVLKTHKGVLSIKKKFVTRCYHGFVEILQG